jgi:hypothetical protein
MPLEMRAHCERCRATASPDSRFFICPAECTYCERCAEILAYACPRCHDELARRPRVRSNAPPSATATEREYHNGR